MSTVIFTTKDVDNVLETVNDDFTVIKFVFNSIDDIERAAQAFHKSFNLIGTKKIDVIALINSKKIKRSTTGALSKEDRIRLVPELAGEQFQFHRDGVRVTITVTTNGKFKAVSAIDSTGTSYDISSIKEFSNPGPCIEEVWNKAVNTDITNPVIKYTRISGWSGAKHVISKKSIDQMLVIAHERLTNVS